MTKRGSSLLVLLMVCLALAGCPMAATTLRAWTELRFDDGGERWVRVPEGWHVVWPKPPLSGRITMGPAGDVAARVVCFRIVRPHERQAAGEVWLRLLGPKADAARRVVVDARGKRTECRVVSGQRISAACVQTSAKSGDASIAVFVRDASRTDWHRLGGIDVLREIAASSGFDDHARGTPPPLRVK